MKKINRTRLISGLILAFILMILGLTNPSLEQFNDFTGVAGKGLPTEHYKNRRIANWLIFSYYERITYKYQPHQYIESLTPIDTATPLEHKNNGKNEDEWGATPEKYLAVFNHFYPSN